MSGVAVFGRNGWRCTYYVLPGGGWIVACDNADLPRAELEEARRLCSRIGHAPDEQDDGTLLCARCSAGVPLEPEFGPLGPD